MNKLAYVYALFLRAACAGDVCDPAIFPGPYGALLSGTTTISGELKPVAVVSRLVFDSSGKVTGTSSVNFAGLLLGNPVTGEYTLKDDCTLTWKLQDDSGNWQNFSGKVSLDVKHVTFGQTDPASPQRGTMVRTSDGCPSSDFLGRYQLRITGTTIDMSTGKAMGARSIDGTLEADGNSGLKFTPYRGSPGLDDASFQVEGECVVTIKLVRGEETMNFRAMVGNLGKEVVGIETDPGTTVTLKAMRVD
jgi:hypothetical protein